MDKEAYQVYLQSDHWKKVRKAAIAYAEGTCQICDSGKEIHVHHRTYARLEQERAADVVVLCAECHRLFHGRMEVASSRQHVQAANRRRPRRAKQTKEMKALVDKFCVSKAIRDRVMRKRKKQPKWKRDEE